MSTNVYIDGFNLYYGAVRNTPFKWLDLAALCSTLLPGKQIKRIRYFTAHIKPLPHNQQAPVRQDIYLRALRTIPNLSIHDESRFASWPRWMPVHPLQYTNPSDPPQSVRVLRTEEKGSDVNLATYLLTDCFDNDFDEAVVISNDSDLSLPIEMVKDKFRKVAGVINPHHTRISGDLVKASSWQMDNIHKKVLATCQFPPALVDNKGTFRKPATW